MHSRALWIGAGAIAAVVASCGERSLVLLQVLSQTAGVSFSNDTLLIKANQQQTTTFTHVSFDDQNAYKAGVYLSSDASGRIILQAEVDDPQRNCIVGMGSVTVDGVSSGQTTPVATLKIQPVDPCVPIGSGTGGKPGTGGGAGGRGGSSSTGGSSATGGGPATGGTTGSGGSATGGSPGTGGNPATGGGNGTGGGGTGGKGTGGGSGMGGNPGTGGVAGAGGNGGPGGAGGMTGAGGKGTGGVVATGGVVGTGGGGTGGIGAGGVMGTGGGGTGGTGTGGSSSCGCTIPNGVCDATGKCVCSQTPAEACSAAGIGCGSATDICGQTVDCSCAANQVCDTATGTCRFICVGGTGGIVAASPDIICPLTPAQ